MFKTLQNALRVKDVRRRLLFTFLMLVVVRIGSQLPVPGVDPDYFADFFEQHQGDAFNLLNSLAKLSTNASTFIVLSLLIVLLKAAKHCSSIS